MNFNQLPLIPSILKATKAAGYEEPTPIQRETIPFVLEGKDVLGCAQTGTGKTAAFALPILQRLTETPAKTRNPRALVLTPTRELAIQIQENFVDYGKYLPLVSCVIFGGVSQAGQVAQLKRSPEILVATPGRLNDLIGQGYIRLSDIEIFVLDEADRMLDMGFIHDVKRVIAQLPAKRQTLFFSATMPKEVEALAMSILHQPESVKVDPVSSTVDAIHQTLYMVDKQNKKYLLADLLKKPEVENALVFTRTKHGADKVVRELEHMGVKAMAIHGNKSQNARQDAMGKFKSGELKVLIATDIAARGIDVAGLSHVFNYDLPNEPEAYVHRIGRTGRAGLDGDAISFCCIDEMKLLYAVEKLIGKKIPRKESAWPMQVFTETVKEPRPPRPALVKNVNLRGEAVAPRAKSAPVGRAERPREPLRGTPLQRPKAARAPQERRFGPAAGVAPAERRPAPSQSRDRTEPRLRHPEQPKAQRSEQPRTTHAEQPRAARAEQPRVQRSEQPRATHAEQPRVQRTEQGERRTAAQSPRRKFTSR